jgi:hypothetical protein
MIAKRKSLVRYVKKEKKMKAHQTERMKQDIPMIRQRETIFFDLDAAFCHEFHLIYSCCSTYSIKKYDIL